MRKSYKRIGDYIQLVDKRNKGLHVNQLLGLSISKQFIPSVANTVGTDMENYKIIRKKQFACSTMQVRRDKKMPVALLQQVDEAIILAIFAHEMFGQETWQKHSSVSVGHIIVVRHVYDDLAQKLQLQQIA